MTTATLHPRAQLAAIAWLRWRMFSNSLRTTRGKAEVISRILMTVFFTVGGMGGAIGCGFGAWYFVSQGKPELLAVMFWAMFLFWQIFPIMSTAFTNNPDSSELLRFPLAYRAYFLVRIAYGSFDPATVLGTFWLTGMLLGIAVANPLLLLWAVPVVLLFAGFNLLFLQMVFAWIERWLAQRKTREIMGVLFILVMLSFQLIGPAMQHYERKPAMQKTLDAVATVQAVLPPGLAADAIAQVAHGHFAVGASSFLFLGSIAALIACLLHLRLRAQYRGENLSEAPASGVEKEAHGLRVGWNLPGFSQEVAAVFEKEVRYLSRSGAMLLALIVPLLMLVVIRLGPLGSKVGSKTGHGGSFFLHARDFIFPAAAAYCLLALTNIVYNSFGGDAGGIQFFYASPARFSQIVLAKNMMHGAILLLEAALSWALIAVLYGRPGVEITIATIAGLLFAAPLNFTAGNLLSLYSPKRVDTATLGRQRASQITVLISLVVQLVLVAVGVAGFLLARLFGNFWIATLLFLVLACLSLSVYRVVQKRADIIAIERREALVSELCRA
jgi:ABC-2 type transport system permease protein